MKGIVDRHADERQPEDEGKEVQRPEDSERRGKAHGKTERDGEDRSEDGPQAPEEKPRHPEDERARQNRDAVHFGLGVPCDRVGKERHARRVKDGREARGAEFLREGRTRFLKERRDAAFARFGGKGVGVVAKEIEGRVAFESEKSVLFTHGEGLKKRK